MTDEGVNENNITSYRVAHNFFVRLKWRRQLECVVQQQGDTLNI